MAAAPNPPRSERPRQRSAGRAPGGRGRSVGGSPRPASPQSRRAPAPDARPPRRASGPRRSASAGRRASSQVGQPTLWTKGPSRAQARPAGGAPSGSIAFRALKGLGGLLLGLLLLVGRGLAFLLRALGSLVSRSKIALAAVVIVCVLGVGLLADLGLNWGKVYPGVHIGRLDASGRTLDEVQALVENEYGSRLASSSATVYADEDARDQVADAVAQAEDAALAQQLSVEDARAKKRLWTADAQSLSATLPSAALAEEALAVGRGEGGIAARIAALFGGWSIAPRAEYGSEELESLASDIDRTLGDPRVDFGIEVAGGVAQVTEGHDGVMVDREAFALALDAALLGEGDGSFIAQLDHAPLRIDREAAQAVCDRVNAAIADGAVFAYEGASWSASAADIGGWVKARVEEREGGWALVPFIDGDSAKPAILKHVEENHDGSAVRVSFERVSDGGIEARTDGTGQIPLAAETAQALDAALFGSGGKADGGGAAGQPVSIAVASGAAPAALPFEEALDLGLVSSIASFTTEYSTGAGTENRNHNIHLVSDLLSDSIVKPGEVWSFNGTAGECNEEAGFLGAGAIINGEYDDAVGGGICQVATTVFNAVYEAGFPVVSRYNHSLYIASYPAGRDAAVSWPDLDLRWSNDADSDVLVRMAYTDTSVTATLYGVDPGYRVSSEVGEWQEGEKHQTRTEVDESLPVGSSYVKTVGHDGSAIAVVRTVTDAEGAVLHQDPFYSTYSPMTEVVVKGPSPQGDGEGEGASAEGAASQTT